MWFESIFHLEKSFFPLYGFVSKDVQTSDPDLLSFAFLLVDMYMSIYRYLSSVLPELQRERGLLCRSVGNWTSKYELRAGEGVDKDQNSPNH